MQRHRNVLYLDLCIHKTDAVVAGVELWVDKHDRHWVRDSTDDHNACDSLFCFK